MFIQMERNSSICALILAAHFVTIHCVRGETTNAATVVHPDIVAFPTALQTGDIAAIGEFHLIAPRAAVIGEPLTAFAASRAPSKAQLYYFSQGSRPTDAPSHWQFALLDAAGKAVREWKTNEVSAKWTAVAIPTEGLPQGTYRFRGTFFYADHPWQRVERILLLDEPRSASPLSQFVSASELAKTLKLPLAEGSSIPALSLEAGKPITLKTLNWPAAVFLRVGSPSKGLETTVNGEKVVVSNSDGHYGAWQEVLGGAASGDGKDMTITASEPAVLYGVRFERLDEKQMALFRSKPEKETKAVVINNDGFSEDIVRDTFTEAQLREQISRNKGTSITQLDWCVHVTGVVTFRSKFADYLGDEDPTIAPRVELANAMKNLKSIDASGQSLIGIVIEEARQINLPIWGSLRMSAYYREEHNGVQVNGDLWEKNPQMRVMGMDGPDGFRLNMSYAFPEVRQQRIGVLNEMIEMGFEGVNLDFCRYPVVFGYEKPMLENFQAEHGADGSKLPLDDPRWVATRNKAYSGFMAETRTSLDALSKKIGRPVKISTRIPGENYQSFGIDPADWAKNKYADIIIPSIQRASEKWFDLEPWQKMFAGTGVEMWVGMEGVRYATAPTELTDAMVRGGIKSGSHMNTTRDEVLRRADEAYQYGATGMYLFNQWKRPETFANVGDPQFVRRWRVFEDPENHGSSLIEPTGGSATP